MGFLHIFRFRKNSPVLVIATLVLGAALAVGGSVWATSIGTNISVTGTLTVDGNSTLGNASDDINLFTGRLQASTTALFTSGFTTYGNWTVDQSATTTVTFNQAGLNFDSGTLMVDAYNNRIGLGTTTPGTTLALNGAAHFNSTLIVGDTLTATSTALLATAGGNVGVGSTTPGSILAVQNVANFRIGTSTIYGGLNVNSIAATSTATSTIDYGTTLSRVGGSVGIATTTASKTLSVGGDGMFGTSATTSVIVTSTSSTAGGCIQLKGTDGTMIRIYATTTPSATLTGDSYKNLVVEPGVCRP